MKVEVFKEAQEAYSKGDYKTALEGFIACTHDVAGLAPADLSKFYHLIGNCWNCPGHTSTDTLSFRAK